MSTTYKKWAMCLVVIACGVVLFPRGKVFAVNPTLESQITGASGATFLDRKTINVNVGGTTYSFVDNNIADDINNWVVQTTDPKCFGQIDLPNNYDLPVTGGTISVKFDMDYRPLGNPDCIGITGNDFQLSVEASQANAKLVWADAGTIYTLTKSIADGKFTQATTPPGVSSQLFIGPGTDCPDLLVVSTDFKTAHYYTMVANNPRGGITSSNLDQLNATDAAIMSPWFPAGCHIQNTYNDDRALINRDASDKIVSPNWQIGHFADHAKAAGTGTGLNGEFVPVGGQAGEAIPSCNNTANGSAVLKWMMCPLIETLDLGIHWLDTNIQGQLIVNDPNNPAAFEGSGTSEALHEAWGRIRNVALIILIPIMLFMVIGTAIGVSFLDAYTVRRAMPRFLIAIVFISLSWYVTSFLINITNAVGTGILGLMTGPWGGPKSDLSNLINIGAATTTTLTGFAIFGGVIVAGAVSLGIIISYAFVALLVLLLGFVLLSIRQLLILTMVLFAPLAILSWIFPNNDKLWKLWWGTFSRMLLVFPLIMMLIGAGKIFAWVIAHTS